MMFIHEIMTLSDNIKSETIKYEDNVIHKTSNSDSSNETLYRFESPYEVEIQECTIVNVLRKDNQCYILIDISETTAQVTLNDFITNVIAHTNVDKTVNINNILLSIPSGTRIDSKIGQNIIPLRDNPNLLKNINCNITMEWRSYRVTKDSDSDSDSEFNIDLHLTTILLNEAILSPEEPESEPEPTVPDILDDDISPGLSTKVVDQLNISWDIDLSVFDTQSS